MHNDLDFSILQEQPVDFIELAFGDRLTNYQQQITNAVRDYKYTTVRSAHDVGKSFLSARLCLWYLYSFPNSKVITTAPTMRQVEDILWREIRAAKAHSRIQLGGHYTQTSIDLSEQWFALGLSTDEPERFQGFHAVDVFLVVDEASGVSEPIFNASEGIVSSQHARVLYIGNPTNTSGTFYRSFKMPGYAKIHISAFDTPNFTEFGITLEDIRNNTWSQKITHELPAPYLITPDWVYDKYLRWGEGNPMWDSRVMGNFPDQGEDSLIPLVRIEEAARRELAVKPEDAEQIGVDVARFGADMSIFTYRKGPKVLDTRAYNHMDTMETATRVRDFAQLYPNAVIAVDEVGVGSGVVDRLEQLLPKRIIYGVNVGQIAFDREQFVNLRTEIFWGLRERFVDGDIDLSALSPVDLEDLSAQLSQIKYNYTARNQMFIEKKEEMKKRGLPSPDRADSLALAFGRLKHLISFGVLEQGTPVITSTAAQTAFPSAPQTTTPSTPTTSQWDIKNPEERAQAERDADLALIRRQEDRRW